MSLSYDIFQAIHGGNALLISLSNGIGRSSLTSLAAYTARCKMFDATSHQDQHNDENVYRAWVRDYIKKASHVTGLGGKPAVLFVRGNMPAGCLQDVCALMNHGKKVHPFIPFSMWPNLPFDSIFSYFQWLKYA